VSCPVTWDAEKTVWAHWRSWSIRLLETASWFVHFKKYEDYQIKDHEIDGHVACIGVPREKQTFMQGQY